MARLSLIALVRRTLVHAPRLTSSSERACLGTLFLLLASVPTHGDPVSVATRSRLCATRHDWLTESPGTGTPTFRLGSAARPFEWSTIIGDFNADGRPDVVVADRVGRSANAYAYRIDLAMSGQPTADVTFESTNEAVTITASDVDRDHDLDIVVALPLSGKTVGVWLNDGHGHFMLSGVHQLPGVSHTSPRLGCEHRIINPSPFDVSRSRASDGIPPAVRAGPSSPCLGLAFPRRQNRRWSFPSLQIPPRAPPTSSQFHA